MKNALLLTSLFGAALSITACSNPMKDPAASHAMASHDQVVAPKLTDGSIQVPADYRSWPEYVTGIDKQETGQIRDIYINPTGYQAKAGEDFADGSFSVMEIWKAKKAADGMLMTTDDGKLVKDELSLVFLMAKSPGAGSLVDPALRTGDWIYAGYAADGKTPAGPPAAACRSCHLQVADTDWVFRYDEYFANRAAGR